MNKYFSKALFYDERKNYSGNIALVSTILTMGLLNFFINLYIKSASNLEVSKEIFRSNLLDTIYIAIIFMIAGILATLYESYNLKEVKYNFMLTQPYNRDAIVITKFIATVMSAIIPLMGYGVVISIVFIISKENSMIVEAWRRIFLASSIAFFVTALGQFFNKIIGKTIIAIFMPIIISVIVPIFLVFVKLLLPLPSLLQGIESFLKVTAIWFFDNLNKSQVELSLVLIFISVVLVIISIVINRRISFEKTSDIFLFKWIEDISITIISFIISTMVALCILILLDKFIFEINLSNNSIVVILDVIIIAFTVIGYKAVNYIKGRVA